MTTAAAKALALASAMAMAMAMAMAFHLVSGCAYSRAAEFVLGDT
jgi:hypothetical protein